MRLLQIQGVRAFSLSVLENLLVHLAERRVVDDFQAVAVVGVGVDFGAASSSSTCCRTPRCGRLCRGRISVSRSARSSSSTSTSVSPAGLSRFSRGRRSRSISWLRCTRLRTAHGIRRPFRVRIWTWPRLNGPIIWLLIKMLTSTPSVIRAACAGRVRPRVRKSFVRASFGAALSRLRRRASCPSHLTPPR